MSRRCLQARILHVTAAAVATAAQQHFALCASIQSLCVQQEHNKPT